MHRDRGDILNGKKEACRLRWEYERHDYQVYLSQFVIDEITRGDFSAAKLRIDMVKGVQLLAITDSVLQLGLQIAAEINSPRKAQVDALHLAISAVYGMDNLLTWNLTHLANPKLADKVK